MANFRYLSSILEPSFNIMIHYSWGIFFLILTLQLSRVNIFNFKILNNKSSFYHGRKLETTYFSLLMLKELKTIIVSASTSLSQLI